MTGYTLTRNYDTDLSRSDVRTLLANLAHELADVKGIDLPTKTVFEEPDIISEDENRFSVPVRPTVTDAGVEPEDIVPSECIRDGVYVRLHGMVHTGEDSDERDTARVTVVDAEHANTRNVPEWDDYLEMWRRIA